MNSGVKQYLLRLLVVLATLGLAGCLEFSAQGGSTSSPTGGGTALNNGGSIDTGGGSSGTGNTGGGSSGTGMTGTAGIAQGTISALDGVSVNGVNFATSPGTAITIDGTAASEADLHVGMIGTVTGLIDPDSSTGTASSVDLSVNIIGAIDTIDLALNSLTVAGQTVVFNTLTVFNNTTAETLKAGDIVKISGLSNIGGQTIAGYIELAPGAGATEIKGLIAGLNRSAKTFLIGTQLIDYSNAQFIDTTESALVDTMLVKVAGNQDSNGTLMADKLFNLTAAPIGQPDDILVLEGIVTTAISSGRFTLSNVEVTTTATTTFINGQSTDILTNTRLTVRGHITEPGKLEADQIEFSILPNITISGNVDAVDVSSGRISVSGLLVDVPNSTRMLDSSSAAVRNFSLQNIGIGDRLTIYGSQSATQINALFLRRDALAGGGQGAGDSVTLRGFASVPAGDPFFDIGTTTVDTSGLSDQSGFLDSTLQPINRSAFFNAIQGNAFVEAVGQLSPPTLTADNAKLLSLGNFTVIDSVGNSAAGANDLVTVWDGSLNTEQDVIDGTTRVNMFISSTQLILGLPFSVHDIRVFGPGTYSFDTCANNVTPVSCGPLTMTVGPNQVGAHMLLDWNLDTNVDAINVWDRDRAFCADVPSPPCSIYPLTADGTARSGLETVQWNLVSSNYDGDGIAGGLLVDGNFANSLTLNLNLNF